jgi:hypothetical protein
MGKKMKITFDDIKVGTTYNIFGQYYFFYKKTDKEALYIYFDETLDKFFKLMEMSSNQRLGSVNIFKNKRKLIQMSFTFRHKERF